MTMLDLAPEGYRLADRRPLPAVVANSWYALRCRGRADVRVIPYLLEIGLPIYYPLVREIRRVPKRELSLHKRRSSNAIMRPRKVPLLPSTIFVGEEVMSHPMHDRVFDMPKVVGFLCVGDVPARIPAAVLDALREREVDGAIAGATPARLLFKRGDKVRVSIDPDDPLGAVSGTIDRVPDVLLQDIDEDTVLRIILDRFGKVSVPAAQVEKV